MLRKAGTPAVGLRGAAPALPARDSRCRLRCVVAHRCEHREPTMLRSIVGSIAVTLAFACALGVCAGLSDEADQDHRAVRGRRTGRRLRALPRRAPAGSAGAARRRRGPPGRRLDHRHRRRREERARRLHAADDVEHAHGQRNADPEQALSADARLRAGRAGQLFGPRAGRASLGRREQPRRPHQARQGESRQAQLRVVRSGHAVPHGRRALQGDGGCRHRPRPVQGELGRAHRRSRRAGADDVRRGDDDERACEERPRHGARHDRQGALVGAPRRADDRRGGRARATKR